MKEQFTKTTMAKRMKLNDCKARINLHKKDLAAEDYKIVKCAELRLLNPDLPLSEMPYDIVELVAKRDRIRGKINDLEADVEKLKSELGIEAETIEEADAE